jgi:very-short-patch-repair endonuclease
MHRYDEIRHITARQHGLIQRSQLAALGIPSGSVAHARHVGQLEWLSERVLRLGGSARTLDQLAMAAALDVPGGAVAVFSAAAMWELAGFELEPVHVMTDRRPHRGGPHLGIVHTSTRFSPTDVMTIRGTPVTSPLRTLRDLAGRLHFDRLDLVCERMVSKRLLRVEQLHALVAELPRRGGARGTAALRRLALSRGPDHRPTESNLERRFQQIVEEAGEGPIDRQVDLGDEEGWIGRVDFIDRGARIVIEVQSSMFHYGRVDRARDEARFARLRRAGWTVIEVNELDIWYHPDRVLGAVRAARRTALSKGGSPGQAGGTT